MLKSCLNHVRFVNQGAGNGMVLRDITDKNRTTSAIQGIVGKRMVYKANGNETK